MGSIKKFVNEHPVLTSAGATLIILWAYHNGHLNALFTGETKILLPSASSTETASA